MARFTLLNNVKRYTERNPEMKHWDECVRVWEVFLNSCQGIFEVLCERLRQTEMKETAVFYVIQRGLSADLDYLRYSERGTTLVTILARGPPIRVVTVTMET